MKLVYGDGWIDLQAPITVTEDQERELVAFFKTLGDVEVVEIQEPKRKTFGRTTKPEKWSAQELAVLLESKSNEEITSQLNNRGKMSVHMKRAIFVPTFTKWMEDNNKAPPIREEDIKEFLEGTNEDS